MADKIKLGEISKNLKITNKDIIAKLAEFGVELKSSASVVDEETIGLIFDIYTEMNQVSEEEIREMREAALKKAREDGNDEEKPAKKPAKKTEEKAEKPAKKEEKKKKQTAQSRLLLFWPGRLKAPRPPARAAQKRPTAPARFLRLAQRSGNGPLRPYDTMSACCRAVTNEHPVKK